jgi:hypothetical protein
MAAGRRDLALAAVDVGVERAARTGHVGRALVRGQVKRGVDLVEPEAGGAALDLDGFGGGVAHGEAAAVDTRRARRAGKVVDGRSAAMRLHVETPAEARGANRAAGGFEGDGAVEAARVDGAAGGVHVGLEAGGQAHMQVQQRRAVAEGAPVAGVRAGRPVGFCAHDAVRVAYVQRVGERLGGGGDRVLRGGERHVRLAVGGGSFERHVGARNAQAAASAGVDGEGALDEHRVVGHRGQRVYRGRDGS